MVTVIMEKISLMVFLFFVFFIRWFLNLVKSWLIMFGDIDVDDDDHDMIDWEVMEHSDCDDGDSDDDGGNGDSDGNNDGDSIGDGNGIYGITISGLTSLVDSLIETGSCLTHFTSNSGA